MEQTQHSNLTKILLVDDDALIRDSFSMAFKKKGFYLVAVESGEEGLHALERERFNVLVSDYRLPGIDGLEFLNTAAQLYPGTANILITAYGEDVILSAEKLMGVHDFVTKPFSPRTLLGSIARLTERRSRRKSGHGQCTGSTD